MSTTTHVLGNSLVIHASQLCTANTYDPTQIGLALHEVLRRHGAHDGYYAAVCYALCVDSAKFNHHRRIIIDSLSRN